ncbi:Salicylic acid-binding protein 2 [Spatholobus suberectus]|nr:Salicylic acid-binding protein 2 [Spatholobus suberectus]
MEQGKEHPKLIFLFLLVLLTSTINSILEASKSKHFVLVHGSCHGAWSWYKVTPVLKSWGHKVTALDLAASGVNPQKALELQSISQYFRPLTEFMASLSNDERVILVGHSLGGLAISHAMEHFPHNISVAVFVSALMPGPTLNITTLNQEDWELATTLMRPLKLFGEQDMAKVLALSHSRFGSVSRVFVVSQEDRVVDPDLQRWMVEHNPPNHVIYVSGSDHMVMMSKPIDICNHLQTIAAHYK